MDRWRIGCSAGLTVLAIACLPDMSAASDICMRLEARLVALDSRGGAERPDAADRAIQKQREELDRATAEARRAGCLGFLRRFETNGSCGRTMASINRMRANLNRLTATRRDSYDRFTGGRQRDELIRALAANGCGEHYEAYDRPTRRSGLFAMLFGGRFFRQRGWGDDFFGNDFGTFRTLCVRTCDGYYFPISFATVSSRFAADEQTCQSLCPGAEAALYVHRNPGEEAESMVSLAGEPYTALPTAFRYRREYDKGCRCGRIAAPPRPATPIAGFTPAARNDPWGALRAGAEGTPAPPDSLPPTPVQRPPDGEDPETLANKAGDLVPTPVEQGQKPVANVISDGRKSIRVVGPSSFYGQE